MRRDKWPSWWLLLAYLGTNCAYADEKYNAIHRDGSFEFSYDTPDSYHTANGDRNNVVRGEFGGRNPKTGLIDKTTYTAGPRGYRPRGKNIARKYDLSQIGPRPVGSKDDPYFDPYEDPSYNFAFNTRTYSREENANRYGDVRGSYTYLDDVGERHNVEFIAGKQTGFHVRTPFPDSNPNAYGPLFFNGRGKPIPRGRTAIQRGLDGSYRFISAGPDQRRTETSDATGHVRGSYTYLDDKGVQHSVHYIAGPETGYRVLKNVKGPHLPNVYPFSRPDIIPPDYYDSFNKAEKELFDTAASGRPRPVGGSRPGSVGDTGDKGIDYEEGGTEGADGSKPRPGGAYGGASKPPFGTGGGRRPIPGGGRRPRPPKPPIDEYEDGGEDIDLFGGEGGGSSTSRPTTQSETSGNDDGRYKPSVGGQGEEEEENEDSFGPTGATSRPSPKPSKDEGSYGDASYKPSQDGTYKPLGGEGAYKPATGEDSLGPSGESSRPSGGGGTFDSQRPSTEGGYKPLSEGAFRPSDDGAYRPSGEGAYRPSGEGAYRPSGEGAHRPSVTSTDARPSSFGSDGEGFSSTATPGGYDKEDGTSGGDEYPGETGQSTGRPASSTRPGTETYDSEGFKGEGGSSVKPSGFEGSTVRPESFDASRPSVGGGFSTSRPDSFDRPGASTYRPSRPIRPRPPSRPFGGGRPAENDFNEQEDDGFNLFGSESTGPVSRPGQGIATTTRPSGGDDFLGPTSESDFDESKDSSIGPQKRPPQRQRPRPSSAGGRPTGFGGGTSGGGGAKPDFGPSESGGYGDKERPAVIGVSTGEGSFYERGTIVTNLGDKVFSVPPGVSVRAHVQAIDLLPLGSRIPSPSEQYRAETTVQTDQFKEASKNVSVTTFKTTTTRSSAGTTYDDDEDIFK